LNPQELSDLLSSGGERSDVEFKCGGRSDDKKFFAKIVRAVLALTNRRDGGIILIGVDEGQSRPATVVGVDVVDLATWTADAVRDRLAVFADPSVDVEVDRFPIDGKDIVAITVREFADVPVICRMDGDELREGAIYVRSRRKPESVELPRQGEMRDLLELATEKRLRSFLATAVGAGLVTEGGTAKASSPTSEERFARQAERVKSPAAEKARSHGYWDVSISPEAYSARRVDSVSALFPIMQQAAVSYRGWPYPSVLPGENPEIGADWVGFDVDSRVHVETWRLHQSGLFTQQMAFWEDWYHQDFMFRSTSEPVPPQGQTLAVDLTVGTLTEIFEFASRLSLSPAGAESMKIRVTARGLRGRHLSLPSNRIPFSTPKEATLTEFIFDPLHVDRESLVASADTMAAEFARELFRRFGWDAPLQMIRDLQAKMRQRW
jgi:hypothetical protein